MSYRPWWTPMDHPFVQAVCRASEAVAGQKSIVSPSMAGTAPMWETCSVHDVPTASLGAARIDSRAHAPDENYRLEDAATAARITARFLDEYASLDWLCVPTPTSGAPDAGSPGWRTASTAAVTCARGCRTRA